MSSPLSKHILFYVHEWLLKPLSKWYTRLQGIPVEPSIHFLPFGFVLKSNPRLREQEGLAMNLARAMGVPAPRFISFGEPLGGCNAKHSDSPMPSLLMTGIPGTMLSEVDDDKVDFEVVHDDLLNILASMRRFASPWGDAVCGVDGGSVYGHFIPASPLSACADEAAFYKAIRAYGNAFDATQDHVDTAERLFTLPRHAIVFTHGDLLRHNIMIGDDGHVSGIIDWEAAAWLPEYWEISVTTLFKGYPWGQFMDKKLASGMYAEEIAGHRAVLALVCDALSY
ncbi:hypothetical protein K466DRAFT_587035 [Polyporus arcularius HHB13444]|uniref:Aminoglycoside phosphotransferase domain-containing protein n=1 Tax=Polyporus arcularius HHB13444 TaxID=1314778 RepID=A0A5C3PCF3_9APHY|nr:hypothetical protein K466DRAFT_587035 [Polyporus arcularius HHB13444]